MKVIDGFGKLFHKGQGHKLRQSPICLNKSQQVPFLGVLHNEIQILLILGNLKQLYNVRMMNAFEDGNLLIDHLEILFAFQFLFRDCFNCYFIACPRVNGQMNLPEAAIAQLRLHLKILHCSLFSNLYNNLTINSNKLRLNDQLN